jgi:hypothetical protein
MGFNKKFFTTGGIVASSASAAPFDPLKNFETVTYTGNGGTQKITGYIRKGAAFNGTSSEINLGNSQPLSVTQTGEISISLWVKTTDDTAYLYAKGDDSAAKYEHNLELLANGTLKSAIYNSGAGLAASVTSTATVDDGNWHHVVVTIDDGSSMSLYIDNGTPVTTTSWSGSVAYQSTVPFMLGAFEGITSAGSKLNGSLDQIRIFNKALSSSEVTTLYGETYASSTKSTTDIFGDGSGVALYELDEDSFSSNFEQAAVFNGSSSIINLGDHNAFSPSVNPLSVSCWIKTTSTIDFIFSKGSSGAYEYGLFIDGSGQIGLQAYTLSASSSVSINTSSAYNDGNWHHIVGVYDPSGNFKIYVDGSQQATSSTSLSMGNSSNALILGKKYDTSSDFFNGSLDQVRIYSSALSASDITKLYNESSQIPTATLVSHYKLDGNATDSAGSNNGTETSVTYAGGVYGGTNVGINFLGMAFSPSFVWVKRRDNSSNHVLFDSVRGVGERLHSDTTDSEASTLPNGLTSFDSNGFTVVDNSGGGTGVNGSSQTYVAWNWYAPTSESISASGSRIASTVKKNVNAGFSIVSFAGGNSSGTTVGTGLNQPIELLIVKNRDDSSDNWIVWHKDVEQNDSTSNTTFTLKGGSILLLNSTSATIPSYSFDGQMGSTGGENLIAYCFHSVTGYQKIGSYSGGSTNVISTGFTPRFLMVKRSNDSTGWYIFDAARNTSNPRDLTLFANSNAAESVEGGFYQPSFVTDGFSWPYADGGGVNASGGTYIYLAIA